VPLVIAEREREILEGNRLKVVVAQVKFPPVHAFSTAEGVAPFQSAIRDDYPISEDRTRQITVRVSPAGVESSGDQPGPWRFLSDGGTWIVGLSPDSLSLETTRYHDYEEFRRRAETLLQIARRLVRPARLDRFGFRFLNELALPEVRAIADWRGFLADDLLGLAVSGDLTDRVTFALQQVNLELDEGKIILKHGFGPGQPAEGTEARPVYLIDIDVFDDRPRPFDEASILGRMDLFNSWAWNLFRANVSDDLIAQLRPAQR
jgi:uncharacterized protein (TIGR04255 family)